MDRVDAGKGQGKGQGKGEGKKVGAFDVGDETRTGRRLLSIEKLTSLLSFAHRGAIRPKREIASTIVCMYVARVLGSRVREPYL